MAVLPIVHYGGAEGIRTPDLLRAREALSQLSYSPAIGINYTSKHGGVTSFLPIGLAGCETKGMLEFTASAWDCSCPSACLITLTCLLSRQGRGILVLGAWDWSM